MTERKYIAEYGAEITDELIDQWADEAEHGFPGIQITPFASRAWEVDAEPLNRAPSV